jgi:hypothetical protein
MLKFCTSCASIATIADTKVRWMTETSSEKVKRRIALPLPMPCVPGRDFEANVTVRLDVSCFSLILILTVNLMVFSVDWLWTMVSTFEFLYVHQHRKICCEMCFIALLKYVAVFLHLAVANILTLERKGNTTEEDSDSGGKSVIGQVKAMYHVSIRG